MLSKTAKLTTMKERSTRQNCCCSCPCRKHFNQMDSFLRLFSAFPFPFPFSLLDLTGGLNQDLVEYNNEDRVDKVDKMLATYM